MARAWSRNSARAAISSSLVPAVSSPRWWDITSPSSGSRQLTRCTYIIITLIYVNQIHEVPSEIARVPAARACARRHRSNPDGYRSRQSCILHGAARERPAASAREAGSVRPARRLLPRVEPPAGPATYRWRREASRGPRLLPAWSTKSHVSCCASGSLDTAAPDAQPCTGEPGEARRTAPRPPSDPRPVPESAGPPARRPGPGRKLLPWFSAPDSERAGRPARGTLDRLRWLENHPCDSRCRRKRSSTRTWGQRWRHSCRSCSDHRQVPFALICSLAGCHSSKMVRNGVSS